jgi:hypothetical protein
LIAVGRLVAAVLVSLPAHVYIIIQLRQHSPTF